MGAHRKYQNRYTTAVSMEQTEKDLCEALGIEHPDAHRIGLHVLIEQRINDSDPRVTSEIIEKFADLKKTLYKDFQAYIRLQDATQTTLQNLKTTAEKKEELIEVWDRGEEAYIRIPKSQFDPEHQTIRVEKVPA
jgi:hypothetical protein